MQPKRNYTSKPKTSKPTPTKPKGAGTGKVVKGASYLPKANKRGM